MDPLLVTVDEAAIVLGLGRSKVYELVMSEKIGRSRRIIADDLRNYVARLDERATDEAAGTCGPASPPFLPSSGTETRRE